MLEVMATASEIRMRQAIADTVTAVEEIAVESHSGATARQVGNRLRLDRSSAYRRLQAAESAGYITNLEERKGRPGRYAKGENIPKEVKMLPTITQLKEAYQIRQERKKSPALVGDAVHGEPTTRVTSNR
jgi:transposase